MSPGSACVCADPTVGTGIGCDSPFGLLGKQNVARHPRRAAVPLGNGARLWFGSTVAISIAIAEPRQLASRGVTGAVPHVVLL